MYDGGKDLLSQKYPNLDFVRTATVEAADQESYLVGATIGISAVVVCVLLIAARYKSSRRHSIALMLSSSRRGGYFDADSFAQVAVQGEDEDDEDEGSPQGQRRLPGRVRGFSPSFMSPAVRGETSTV